MLLCKLRKDEGDDILGDYNSRLQNCRFVLLEFAKLEASFKMKDIDYVDLMTKLFSWSNEFRISKRDLYDELKQFNKLNHTEIKHFLD